MRARPKYAEALRRERALAPFIPYSSQLTSDTLLTRDGDLVRLWRLGGISHETADPAAIQRRLDELNTALKSWASPHVALWTHLLRRRLSDRLVATFDNAFCRSLDQAYYDTFADYRMMANELYLTLLYRPQPARLGRALIRAARRSLAEIQADQRAALHALDELGRQLEANLRRYDPERLTTYPHERGGTCSRPLELLNYLLTGVWQPVRLPRIPLYDYLGNAWVFLGAETLELRAPTRVRYAQLVDLKDYPDETEPGLLDALLYEDAEFILTQSFSFYGKPQGLQYLKRQQRQLLNTADAAASQIEAMAVALDELTSGQFAMGEYHFSLLVFGDTVEDARRQAASSMTVLRDRGFLPALVTTASDAAFFAQLPGNWTYRPRLAVLTSRNFAGLSSFHNFFSGKRDGNPWGQAVTMFKTPSGQPLFFNFHASRLDEDSFDKKLLANVRLIGQSGTGKTVFINLLLCQAQKFKTASPTGFSCVFFDKDRGAELVIRALGGRYLAIRNGQPSGLNPFQLEPTERNLLFLERLVAKLVQRPEYPLSPADEARISHAVRTVMRMPRPLRRLTTITQNLTEGPEREQSVLKRLSRWCAGGPLAWVFDNPTDQLDFTTHSVYGIDGTDFLDNPEVCTPLSMVLLQRLEELIDGRRFIYLMDEAWKWVADDTAEGHDNAFAEFAGDKQLTIRKQNGLGVFSTQMPSSLLRSKIAAQLVQQVATEVYLPNPKADHDEYVHGFKLSAAEFELIKNFPEDSRLFLLKQGHQSAIGQFDLTGLDDLLAVLSGSTDNIALLDEIRAEVGDDPAVWLPLFHQRRHARRAAVPRLQTVSC